VELTWPPHCEWERKRERDKKRERERKRRERERKWVGKKRERERKRGKRERERERNSTNAFEREAFRLHLTKMAPKWQQTLIFLDRSEFIEKLRYST
jgi:hypothetical protein